MIVDQTTSWIEPDRWSSSELWDINWQPSAPDDDLGIPAALARSAWSGTAAEGYARWFFRRCASS